MPLLHCYWCSKELRDYFTLDLYAIFAYIYM